MSEHSVEGRDGERDRARGDERPSQGERRRRRGARSGSRRPNPRSTPSPTSSPPRARRRAAEIDAGRHLGPLVGVPFAVKNLFDIKGLPTRAGSKINLDGPIAGARRRAGAQARGGRRDPGRRAEHGRVRLRLHRRERALRAVAQSARSDAHDRRLVGRLGCGGRGGRGAAGAGLRHQRLDPRAVVAVRPVRAEADLRAAEPRRLLPFVDAFDHLGPLARSAEDLALSFDAMQGWDPDDPVCTDRGIQPTVPTLHDGIGSLRIAIAGDYFTQGGEPECFDGGGDGRQGAGRDEDRRAAQRGGGARGRLRHHRRRGRAAPPAAAAHAAAGFRSRHARALHGRRAAARPPGTSRRSASAASTGRRS